MYYDFIHKNSRLLKAILAIIIGLVVFWFIFTAISHSGKVKLQLAIVPSDSTITINGSKYSNGSHWITPGTYTVKVSKPGFKSQSRSVILSPEKDVNVATFSLEPESQKAKAWVKSNLDLYKANEKYGALEAGASGKYLSNRNPIISNLPFKDPYFTIGYIQNPDSSITLTVATPSPRYRFFALEQIRKLGYDPTDFKINFKDFVNPLAPPKSEVKS